MQSIAEGLCSTLQRLAEAPSNALRQYLEEYLTPSREPYIVYAVKLLPVATLEQVIRQVWCAFLFLHNEEIDSTPRLASLSLQLSFESKFGAVLATTMAQLIVLKVSGSSGAM